MTAPARDDDWFERVWEYREETLYPSLFGQERTGIYPIPWERLQEGNLSDPRWNTCGVFKFNPTSERPSWLYVTSGLSNAWFDETPTRDGTSGFGCEFVFETIEDEQWPIQRLHQLMIFQIGLCCGKYPGSPPLADLHRVPLGSALDWKASSLTHLMLAAPRNYPGEIALESGHADLFAVVGIAESEVAFARESGGDALLSRLIERNAFPVTDPCRSPVIGPMD